MNTIPTKINRYNVYNKGNRLLGVGEEMALPDFEPSSETVTGAGILGEIDDPTVGYFGNQELEIPFRLLDKETADMMDMTKAVQLEIRGAVDLFAEDLEPAHRFFDLQLSLRRDDGHARGVIPAVFQMREPVQALEGEDVAAIVEVLKKAGLMDADAPIRK